MCNCISATLRGLWSIIVVLLRIVLFLVCLPLALSCLYGTTMVTTRLPSYSLASGGVPVILSFGFVMLWILMHFVGCYGAFFNHKASLKAFAAWTLVIAVVTFLSSVSLSADLEKGGPEMQNMMASSMDRYDWNNAHANNSTEFWNVVQSGFNCCGLKNAKDWDDFAPAGWIPDEYPSSCCSKGSADIWFDDPHPHRCLKDEIYSSGCGTKAIEIERVVLYLHYFLVSFEAMLFLMTLIIVLHQAQPSQPILPIVTARRTDPREYQKFDGSVYVRQLPANPSYHNQQPDVKYPALYPDSMYQQAPPSYGAK